MTVGGYQGHQEGNQADEVEVVQVSGLLQQKDVGDHQEEGRGAHSVKKADSGEYGGHRHQIEEGRHPVAGQRTDEVQGPVGEVELLAREVPLHPIVVDESPDFPEHYAVEGDSEVG